MARDPYRYFRIEARELVDGLSQGVLALEKGSASPELLARVLRQAHTLKGAARVVRLPDIADMAHKIEDLLEPYREGSTPPRESVEAALTLLDAMEAALRLIDAGHAPPAATEVSSPPAATGGAAAGAVAPPVELAAVPPVVASEAPMDSVRVEIRELDALLDGISVAAAVVATLRGQEAELEKLQRQLSTLAEQLSRNGAAGQSQATLSQLQGTLDRSRRALAPGLDRLQSELGRLRADTDTIRLLPVSAVFGPVERALRDAAQTVNKNVRFETCGGAHRADAHVLSALRDALMHVVRNAVDHGVETESERAAAGKPAQGHVRLEVERRGSRLAFKCHDDGRGIDPEAVRRAAVRRGLVDAAEAQGLSLDEAMRLVFRPGLSSAARVTQLSGRGIGLDVVREAADRLKGRVAVRSQPGKGSCIEIEVPLTLAALAVLQVEAAGMTALIPMDAVARAVRVTQEDIVARAHGQTLVTPEDGAIPFAQLATVLGDPSSEGGRLAVVVQSSAGRAALGVDRLLGICEVAVRSLPPEVGPLPLVAGAELNAEGCRVVLDPAGLVEAAARSRPVRTAPPIVRPPILVIDDSLTTRMLEQSILESAGYDVELAVSAEEGMEKALQGHFGLFVVDVEMPGMDGFTFVEKAGATPALADIPAILVTSCASPEHRRRGVECGARAYVVKGEFDQVKLLEIIRGLIG